MDDLIVFLRARLDEDEEVARETHKNEQFVHGTDRWFASHSNAITSMAPHRATAEVDAKRRILDRLYPEIESMDRSIEGEWGGWSDESGNLLKLLALPYVDHPDYDREEWRP